MLEAVALPPLPKTKSRPYEIDVAGFGNGTQGDSRGLKGRMGRMGRMHFVQEFFTEEFRDRFTGKNFVVFRGINFY
jgi:hypothetical protein